MKGTPPERSHVLQAAHGSTVSITDLAIDWLKQRDSQRPFCLLVHHKAPHANWEAPERFVHQMAQRIFPEPTTFRDDYAGRSTNLAASNLHIGPFLWDLHYRRGRKQPPIPADVEPKAVPQWVYQRYIRDYLACIASVDENVGRLLHHLDRTGLAADTLVIYTSDQGFFLGEHGLYDKRLMYEPSLQMPLLARWPGVVKAGSVEKRLVTNLDFAPTLLESAGLQTPAHMQGESLLPLLQAEPPQQWRSAILYRFYENAYGIGPIEGVRTDRHKLVHWLYGDEAWELYDLQHDPHETVNLHQQPAWQTVGARLHGTMDVLKQRYGLQ